MPMDPDEVDNHIRLLCAKLRASRVTDEVIAARLVSWGVQLFVKDGADPDTVMNLIEMRLVGE